MVQTGPILNFSHFTFHRQENHILPKSTHQFFFTHAYQFLPDLLKEPNENLVSFYKSMLYHQVVKNIYLALISIREITFSPCCFYLHIQGLVKERSRLPEFILSTQDT